jgi:thymidylate synthase (FAD)
VAILLQNEGCFELITPKEEIRKFPLIIEKAGRNCYQSETGPIDQTSAEKFCRMLIKRGHLSVLEHSIITVKFLKCSRGKTHEAVRHRIASFSQESTRYVDYAKGDMDLDQFQIQVIIPPDADPDTPVELENGETITLREMFNNIERYYRCLRKAGYPPENARQVLPIGLRSDIVISANLREWRHIFSMRTGKPAHWEIRRVMCNLLTSLKDIIPVIFEDFKEAGKDKYGIPYFEQISI